MQKGAGKSREVQVALWKRLRVPVPKRTATVIRGERKLACAPLCCKACAVRPVFAPVVGELRAADPSNLQGPVKQNASPGEQSEAPRPRRKLGQEQNPGPENQDSQHMLEQPRGYFPEKNQPEVFQTEVFSWTSARRVRAKMLVFPGSGWPDRSFWPDVRRDVQPKASVFGLIFCF